MRRSLLCLMLGSAIVAAGCEASKSETPLSPSVAGPIAGVTISAPQATSPSSNSEIAVNQQPVKLTVKNADTTGVRPLSYLFEVATDVNFTQKAYSRASIPPGEGQTTHTLSDMLAKGTYTGAPARKTAPTPGTTHRRWPSRSTSRS